MSKPACRPIAAGPVALALSLGLALLPACSYQGAIDTPVTQKATWFSYLNGDDIRARCRPGASTEFRLVYNGTYNEQIRSYEIVADGSGGAVQTSRVQGRANLTSLAIGGFDDLLAPWRWTRSQARLTPAEASRLADALTESGLFVPLGETLALHSIGFWWIAAGCNAGQFLFKAWRHPSPGYDALTFPEVLLAKDRTGIAITEARIIPPSERSAPAISRVSESDAGPTFRIEAGAEGLVGFRPLLPAL